MKLIAHQTIYVFNKFYLSSDLEHVLHDLHVQAELQPVVEGIPLYLHILLHSVKCPPDSIASTPPFRITQLARSYIQTAHIHVERVNHVLTSMHYQQRALGISSGALDHHVLTVSDGFEGLAAIAERELEKQGRLLGGLDADLEIASRVKVHKEFLSPTMRQAMESGDKGRSLGDYVSKVKMQQVAASCQKTHDELKSRFEDVQEAMARLSRGGDEVRHAMGNNAYVGSLLVFNTGRQSIPAI